ncbi:MAG: ATP-dependent DNA ligase [Solirubrobacterales bacterium]|nr:ATP-dependent DNA ligase [Solirubrobacterales bacterium]
MALPLAPPLPPQLARSRATLPDGDGWAYEPKWDGFRAIAFVDGAEAHLQSRNGKDLTRYFPELAFEPGRYVLDGEIVIFAQGEGTADEVGRQEFNLLGQRIHPAASRIALLAEQTPARYVAFDLLALDDETWLERSYDERRAGLEALVRAPVDLTPVVLAPGDAEAWLHGAEGVIAKERAAAYRPGERTGMVKVKRVRTIDCVVVGWRPGKADGTLGALILGLYAEDGALREIGHSSGFSAKRKRELPAELAPYETGQRGSGEPSRWSAGRDLEWIALRPELVVEITFDHTSDGRIRHGAKVQRWREDKDPGECRIEQLQS